MLRPTIWSLAATLLLAASGHLLAEARARGAEDALNKSRPLFYDTAETDGGGGGSTSCGYASCPKIHPTKLNVHVIAHTHDDVGWLKTVDQYFYATRKRFSPVGVEFILDSLIPALMMDKTKRFVYVEMSFFFKWWNEQDDRMKSIVKQLVQEGRLEFINGGWCMNDEAVVTYHSTIEQMTLGLKFLNDTFGACGHPKVGWQIDPFGHSNEQASLFAQFGFDGMFFSRIGYKDKQLRTQDRSLDLIWHGDRALPGQTGSIFTNVFRDHYELGLFCFDATCLDDAVVDNKNSYEYNVDRLASKLVDYARGYAKSKLTNNILVPFGGDFHFTAAGQNFKSFDRLIKYVRANTHDINIFYSTPSCYQLAVHDSIYGGGSNAGATRRNLSLPEKYDDFMPYDSSATVWWSGYFTSRPSTKLIERETAQTLQVVRMISLADLIQRSRAARVNNNNNNNNANGSGELAELDWASEVEAHESRCLMPLWEILGDLQHHDAVTGTEKQHVTADYQRRAADAARRCAELIGSIKRPQIDERLRWSRLFGELELAAAKVQLNPVYLEATTFCRSLNISQCEALESEVDANRYAHLPLVRAHLASHQHAAAAASNLSHSIPHKHTALPHQLETKSVLLTVYNPLARPVSQADVRLPCNGRCDLDKVQVIDLASNQSLKLIRLALPAGVSKLAYRESHTTSEILFYADLPALGSASFVIGDENTDDLVDEELTDDVLVITDETSRQNKQNVIRARRIQRRSTDASNRKRAEKVFNQHNEGDEGNDQNGRYQYFNMALSSMDESSLLARSRRDAGSLSSTQSSSDRVVLKFDMRTGMITGLKRASDGSALNITQRFGQYFAADAGHPPGAYIFRPNSSEPALFEKPVSFKMYKRQNGGLIEIHQKWADWIWQTIRVDSKKNYIEFDYVIGPIPVRDSRSGREVISRYSTNMANDGVFLTDSNARQLLPRRRLADDEPTQTGGSFYPVTSTIMIRNNRASRTNVSAEAVAVLVDRAQAGTSLNNGDLELLLHRRHLNDDNFGVQEALDEPGEDGRGLVTRGKHRLFLKFQDLPDNESGSANSKHAHAKRRGSHKQVLLEMSKTPRQNLTHERAGRNRGPDEEPSELGPTYLIYDQLYNDIRQESVKYALRPLLTFDRLRVSAGEFVQMYHNHHFPKSKGRDLSLLNNSLPSNVHLLTLQPWNRGANQILIRLENLDNPLIVHPTPDESIYETLLKSYESAAMKSDQALLLDDPCNTRSVKAAEIDIEFLLRDIRIISLSELNLGANAKLSEDKRLDWTQEQAESCKQASSSTTSVKLGPRQIKTFLATFELL